MRIYCTRVCFVFLVFICKSLHSQDLGTDYLWQLSPEIRVNTEKFEFRFRPQETLIWNNKAENYKSTFKRTDFVAGILYKKFKFFVYSRFDSRNHIYLGPRIDFNTSFFNKRLLLHGQYRIFKGLTSVSVDHQYIIDVIEFNTNPSSNKSFNFGLLGSVQHNFGSRPFIFQGPMIKFPFFVDNISFVLSYLKDLNSKNRFFTFFQMNIKIKTFK